MHVIYTKSEFYAYIYVHHSMHVSEILVSTPHPPFDFQTTLGASLIT